MGAEFSGTGGGKEKQTEVGEHVDHIVVCDLTVIVTVQYLERFAHLTHLARGKFRERVIAQRGMAEGCVRGRCGPILNGGARG